MIGALIGDIVGSRFEFDNTFDYNFELFTKESDFTDDSICTLAVADAILTGTNYQDKLLEWCRKYPHPYIKNVTTRNNGRIGHETDKSILLHSSFFEMDSREC